MQELLRADYARIIDFEQFLAVVGDDDFKVIAECPAERAYHICYGFGHAVFTPHCFCTSSIPRRTGSFAAISTVTGVPLNVGIPVE